MFKLVHIGIPTTQKREGEILLEDAGIYCVPPEKSPFAIEYVRFLPDSMFPEEMHFDAHIAGEVDSIDTYIKYADSIIMNKTDFGDIYFAFIKKDGVILELIEKKQ